MKRGRGIRWYLVSVMAGLFLLTCLILAGGGFHHSMGRIFKSRQLMVQPFSTGIPSHLFDCRAPQLRPLDTRATPCIVRRACAGPQVCGHRGAGGELGRLAPESTLAAVRVAILMGLDYIEIDARPTLDGHLVAMHDASVDRTTTGTGNVAEMTLNRLQGLTIRADRYSGQFGCERVAELREILELARGRIVVIIDADKTDRVDLIVEAIHQARARDWAIFDATDISRIDRALAIDPTLLIQIRPASVDQIVPQFRHFARAPVIVELRPDDVRDGARVVHRLGARALTDVFEQDRSAETSGTLSGYRQVLRDGADIIQGDRPELMLSALPFQLSRTLRGVILAAKTIPKTR